MFTSSGGGGSEANKDKNQEELRRPFITTIEAWKYVCQLPPGSVLVVGRSRFFLIKSRCGRWLFNFIQQSDTRHVGHTLALHRLFRVDADQQLYLHSLNLAHFLIRQLFLDIDGKKKFLDATESDRAQRQAELIEVVERLVNHKFNEYDARRLELWNYWIKKWIAVRRDEENEGGGVVIPAATTAVQATKDTWEHFETAWKEFNPLTHESRYPNAWSAEALLDAVTALAHPTRRTGVRSFLTVLLAEPADKACQDRRAIDIALRGAASNVDPIEEQLYDVRQRSVGRWMDLRVGTKYERNMVARELEKLKPSPAEGEDKSSEPDSALADRTLSEDEDW